MFELDKLTKYKDWLTFKSFVRQHFIEQGLTEVETPTLVEGPAFEAYLEVFTTHWEWGGRQSSFCLPTSPEISIKKLIASGWNNLFEIKNCFRNNELSPTHEPEFQMLEWYRVGDKLELLVNDIQLLFNKLTENNWIKGECLQLKTVSMAEVFYESVQFKLTPQTTREELVDLSMSLGLDPEGGETREELFDWVFVHKIEETLKQNHPIILHSYPPWMPTLAKTNEQGWAERFELYFRGYELANAFNELLNYEEHERRWLEICNIRIAQKLPPLTKDQQFFEFIKNDLPPTLGIALGLDRLFLAIQNHKNISDFKVFAKFI
ncbi:MAG: hypothetical protein KDD58_00080 [Bdellovibrionales bacterium]|nr:hypothetical protein [Bdellovibrionales bacterium]